MGGDVQGGNSVLSVDFETNESYPEGSKGISWFSQQEGHMALEAVYACGINELGGGESNDDKGFLIQSLPPE